MTYDGSFNRFLKFSLIDFAVNMKRTTPIPIMNERTIFVETASQMFKYFGNITGFFLISYTSEHTSILTCAKIKDKKTAAGIFFAQQQKPDTSTLLDGIGISDNNNTSIVIESSGLNISTNFDYALEQILKRVKKYYGKSACLFSTCYSNIHDFNQILVKKRKKLESCGMWFSCVATGL
ncbi:hypothetical protein BD560DRAFT_425864 [Blakeslea trispora]|nr:hypothetical protein BD560DRAFT_425864 [Blakeslea trispora]